MFSGISLNGFIALANFTVKTFALALYSCQSNAIDINFLSLAK